MLTSGDSTDLRLPALSELYVYISEQPLLQIELSGVEGVLSAAYKQASIDTQPEAAYLSAPMEPFAQCR